MGENRVQSAMVDELIAREGPGVQISIAARRLEDGRTWEHNARQVYPAASTIKLAILIALHQAVDAGRLRLDELRPAQPGQRAQGSGVLTWLTPGLALTLADHAYLMIAISDNTASNVLIDAVGIDVINRSIVDLGSRETVLGRHFLGRTPLPDEGDNVTSAHDLVTLLSAIADGTAASPRSCALMLQTLTLQQYRDELPRLLPATIQFAGKSGWLDILVHDSGLFTGPGGTLAVAVLTAGYPDKHAAGTVIGEIGLALAYEAGIVGL